MSVELEHPVAELPGVGVADVVSVEMELPVAELPGVGVADVVSIELELLGYSCWAI